MRAMGGRRGSAPRRRQLAARRRQRAAVSHRRLANRARDATTIWRGSRPISFAASRRGAEAGFDWLELHCAHGYLLSRFISPLTNRRGDEYGGDLAGRCRYPLEVFAAVRAAWPADRPISVRISAHDWAEGGITPDDAVAIGRLFKAAGADMIDCSSGQVVPHARPVYGRMYQTPFADRIRNEAGIATIAVGAIFEADHANSIIAAGRPISAPSRGRISPTRHGRWTKRPGSGIRTSHGRRNTWRRNPSSSATCCARRRPPRPNAGLTPQQIAAKLLEG